MKKWIFGAFLGVFLGLILLGGFIFFRTGAYKPVRIFQKKMGPYTLIYKERWGPYHKGVQILESVEKQVEDLGWICQSTFGRYLDNPNVVDHSRLRSHVGCLFEGQSSYISEAQLQKNSSLKDLKWEIIEQKEYLVGEFFGSPTLVGFKVYPKLTKKAQKQRLKLSDYSLEIYQIFSKTSAKTQVLFEVKKPSL